MLDIVRKRYVIATLRQQNETFVLFYFLKEFVGLKTHSKY